MVSGTRKANAALLAGDGRVERIDVDLPQPGPHQVRVRLQGSGVCASNLPAWEGRPWFDYPLAPGAPGHEGWGVVDALGSSATDFTLGERVAALSYNAYAEVDIAASNALVRLPPEFDDQPFPGEPLGCAMNIFRRSGVQTGQTVAIIGTGFLGALLTELAAAAGARVIAVSRRPFALEMAREKGADATVRLSDDPGHTARQINALTHPDCCQRVIEVTGHQSALDVAADIIGVRGRLVIAGYHQDGLRHIDMQQWNWKGLDVVNAHEREPEVYVEGIRQAVDAVRDGRLNPLPLYTHRFGLHELTDAFEALRQRPDGFIKALVMP
ncbi:MAG: MDR/zinc-dependent alcohol dehydrogenase-like family protein [Gammaproteobacteria bacterium]